jgi:alkylhydroperoxidase family enzyme
VTTGVDLLATRPELAEHRATMLDRLWRDSGVPPRLLELARLRVAVLVHDDVGSATRTPAAVAAGLDEDLVDALSAWPTDPRFTPTDRAALAVTEQFVVDCHGVTDAQVAALRDALGDRPTVGFLIALALFDGFSRASTVLRGF